MKGTRLDAKDKAMETTNLACMYSLKLSPVFSLFFPILTLISLTDNFEAQFSYLNLQTSYIEMRWIRRGIQHADAADIENHEYNKPAGRLCALLPSSATLTTLRPNY